MKRSTLEEMARAIAGYAGGVICNLCRKSYDDKAIVIMHCAICHYDVCPECYAKKACGIAEIVKFFPDCLTIAE